MPLDTETYDLADAYDDLVAQIDELEAEAEEYADDTPHYAQAVAVREELDRRRQGLEKFAEAYPDAESVTLGELNANEYAALERHLPDDYTEQQYRTVMTAVATVEAPYLPDDPTIDAIRAEIRESVHPYFTRWTTARADDLLESGGVDENPFSRTSETETEGVE